LYLLEYLFANRLYPGSLEVTSPHTWGLWLPVDGDVIFQPRKIDRYGLYKAVEGRALIYFLKEQQLDDSSNAYPAALCVGG